MRSILRPKTILISMFKLGNAMIPKKDASNLENDSIRKPDACWKSTISYFTSRMKHPNFHLKALPHRLYILFILIFPVLPGWTQPRIAQTDITEEMNSRFPQYRDSFGSHKIVVPDFEKQIMMALSYYPELRNTRIHFKLSKGKSGIISSRPTWGGVFRKSSKRQYVVLIGDTAKKANWALYRHSGPNGQVGIMGHELAHILYFSGKSSFGLIGLGIDHMSDKAIDQFEYNTDSVDVERGLGYQLLDWNYYLRKSWGVPDPENTPDPFTQHSGRERYMSPSSIKRVMSKSTLYK